MRKSDKIDVTVTWNGGSRWGKFPFWMSDEAIIRDTIAALGPLGPQNPEGYSVERESGHGA